MAELIPAATFTHVDQFQPHISAICGRFDVRPSRPDGAMRGRLSLERLGGAEVAFVGLAADHVVRAQTDIKRDPGNHFFLIIQDKGHAVMRQGAHRCLLREGDMFLVDSATPAHFDYQGHYCEQISLHLPRADMQSRFGDRIRGGIDVKREDALSVAMRSVLRRMLDRNAQDQNTQDENTQDENAQDSNYLAEAFLSILGAFLVDLDRGDRPSIGDGDSLIAAALHEISMCYKDAEFGPQQLAVRLGVSLRVLQRAFRQIEETPRQKILATRLTRAYDALRFQSHDSGQRTVSTIAFAQGFNDLSYFYREFRKRYGFAPGEVRQVATDDDTSQ